jgi:N-acetylneuraminic acid mutarotase
MRPPRFLPARSWLVALAVALLAAALAGCAEAPQEADDAGVAEDPGRVARQGSSLQEEEVDEAETPREPELDVADPSAPASSAIEAVARLAPSGGGRYGATAAWDGQAFYVFGGYEGGRTRVSNSLDEILRFVPGEALAQPAGSLNGQTWDAVAVPDGERILVFGGADPRGGTRDEVQAFDPASGRSTVVGEMPAGRSMAAAAATDLGVFVFGGSEQHGFEVLLHAPGDVTSPYPSLLPAPTMGAQAAVLDGVVYVVGGREGETALNAAGGPIDSVLRFDPAAGTFTEVAKLPGGRGYGALIPHDGALYYFGGFASGASLDEIVRIDVEAGTTKLLEQRLPLVLSSVAGATNGQHVYLFGGNSKDGPSPYVLRVDLARLA